MYGPTFVGGQRYRPTLGTGMPCIRGNKVLLSKERIVPNRRGYRKCLTRVTLQKCPPPPKEM